jgi:hypothetical protein
MRRKKIYKSYFIEGDTVYTRTGRERRINEGHLKNWEDGFMMGYEEEAFFEDLV